jgi:hypothetical protein
VADAADLTGARYASQGAAVPIKRSSYVAAEMREVTKLAEVENLRRSSRLIVEAHHDPIQVLVRSHDRLSYGVVLSARANCSI